MDYPGACNASGIILLGLREGKRRKHLSIETAYPLQCTYPDYSLTVYYHAPNIIINQAILLGIIGKEFPIIFGYPSFSSEPNIALFVLYNSSHRNTTEALTNGEIFERISIVAEDPIAIRPEP